MPNTPRIVTRSETTSSNTTENLNKGSKLTFAEMDSNFLELRNGSIGIVGDDSTGIDIAHGSTLKVAGTGGISTTVSGDTLTVDASSIVTSTLGDLTAIGSTLISPSNADLTLQASGTGEIVLNDPTNIKGALTLQSGAADRLEIDPLDANYGTTFTATVPHAMTFKHDGPGAGLTRFHVGAGLADEIRIYEGRAPGSSSTDYAKIDWYESGGVSALNIQTMNSRGIKIEQGTSSGSKITIESDDLTLDAGGGDIILNDNIQAGPNAASGLNNTTITGGNNQSVSLIGGSTGGTVRVMPGPGNGTGELGDIELTPASGGNVDITSGNLKIGTATYSNNSIILDQLQWTGNKLETTQTNANLELDTAGTGKIFLGEIEVDPTLVNRDTFTAINIPFSSDGSTSQDVSINLDSNGDPNITFNHASTNTGQGAKIKTNTGNLILQSGSQRIELAANTVQIGNNTIVVSGNRMFTDASNEDLEFDANGTGDVSSLAQLNMNSNKIVNVTDPTADQDAATKAYVDAQVLASGDTGDLTITGSTITAPSNADLTLAVAGTGVIEVDGTLTATEVISDLTGTIEFDAKATEAITKGEAVYIAGISGNTPTVALARANAAGTMPAFGIAAADIALNATGKITTFGSLTGLDAADFGETDITFALRDTVYISSAEAGKLTNVAPTGESNFIQNIGKIERATPTTNITIKVGGAGRSNATPALNDGNIFIGNASNQATTTSLQTQVEAYSINNVVEDTTPQLGGDLDVNGNSIVSASGGDISITPDTTGNIILDGLTFPNADGTADQILGTNGSGVLSFRDPTAINIDGGVADSVYTSVPTIDGGQA